METLTTAQRRQWQSDGYLHLESVFDADEVRFFSDEMDRIRQIPGWEPHRDPELPIGHYAWKEHADDRDPGGFMDRRDLLTYHQAFIDLIDASPVFDYIVDIMGHNILLSMTQAIIRPADPKFPGYTHTDGGESLRLTRVGEIVTTHRHEGDVPLDRRHGGEQRQTSPCSRVATCARSPTRGTGR